MARSLIKKITLPKIEDDCFLSFGQYSDHIPFPIKRVYYIWDAKPGLLRGAHTHLKTKQIIFCLRGKFRLVLDDGKSKNEILMTVPNEGVYLAPLIWHEMHDLTKETIILVLASRKYEPKDYVREYRNFLKLVKR